ncbi:MAG: GNAT family N-acetyltransferase [Aeromicrobium sp.]|nr:GNAT family N-acetyltransferase [Burkholderiales bacterium]
MKWPNEVQVTLPDQGRTTGNAPQLSAKAGHLVMECYEDEVPQFVDAEIARRYGSLFSTIPHFRQTGKLTATTSTYITRKNGNVETVLLFNRSEKQVMVLNELIPISKTEAGEFIAFVFARYGLVSNIVFNAITSDLRGLRYPYQQFLCAEDIVIGPLTNVDEYSASLSKNYRKSVRRCTNALLRSHPGYRFAILPPEAVSEDLVRQIIGFNKARMAEKEKMSAYTDEECDWIVALASKLGVVSVITIDGKVCAGTVCCQVGHGFHMLVSAHHPDYNQFGMGMLCCYRSICEYIERGGTQVHLLWGRHAYKTSLGATSRQFDRFAVYRSRVDYWRDADKLAPAAAAGYLREARLWLMNAEGQDNFKGRIVTTMWRVLRQIKQRVVAIK